MMGELLAMATEAERRTIEMVLKDLIDKRAEKATGEVRYGVVFSDGGIRERTIETKMKVR
jgi:hypothetical protein